MSRLLSLAGREVSGDEVVEQPLLIDRDGAAVFDISKSLEELDLDVFRPEVVFGGQVGQSRQDRTHVGVEIAQNVFDGC